MHGHRTGACGVSCTVKQSMRSRESIDRTGVVRERAIIDAAASPVIRIPCRMEGGNVRSYPEHCGHPHCQRSDVV